MKYLKKYIILFGENYISRYFIITLVGYTNYINLWRNRDNSKDRQNTWIKCFDVP